MLCAASVLIKMLADKGEKGQTGNRQDGLNITPRTPSSQATSLGLGEKLNYFEGKRGRPDPFRTIINLFIF